MSQSRGLESSTARRAWQGIDMALRRQSDVVDGVAMPRGIRPPTRCCRSLRGARRPAAPCEFQLKESANPGRPPRVSLHIRMPRIQQIGAKIC